MRNFARILVVSCLPALLPLSTANAESVQASYDARTDRLEGLDTAELALLDSLLVHGPVALVENADAHPDQLSAINVAVLVHAPARALESVVVDPARYPAFMP